MDHGHNIFKDTYIVIRPPTTRGRARTKAPTTCVRPTPAGPYSKEASTFRLESVVMYSIGVRQEPEEAIQHNVNAGVHHNVNGGVQRNVGGGVVNDCCPNAVSLLVLPGTMHA